MMKRILFCLISFFSIYVIAQPPNINLSGTFAFAGEPYLAVNPANPQNIVVAWMAADLSTGFKVSIKTKTSFNGGQTWGNQFIQPHFSSTWGSADVSLQFDPNGTLYLSYIDYRENPDSGAVYVTHSGNGGVSWSAPVVSIDILTDDPTKSPLDRPWLALDNSQASSRGMMYLTTKPAPWILPPNRPYLKSSSDNGLSWGGLRYLDSTGYLVGNLIAAPMAAPAVTMDGALCIAYPSYLLSQSVFPKFVFAKSYNKGVNFSYNDLLVNFPTMNGSTEYKLGYKISANPVNASQLAFAFIGNSNGDPDVFVTVSNNGGLNWETPVKVNDDSSVNGRAQDLVWAGYSNNGILLVSWRDRRNGTDSGFSQPCDTYCAISRNNGRSFQSNLRLSDVTAPFDPVLSNSGNDFMSCELVNDTIYAAWSDVRNSKLNIYFTKTLVNCYKNNWTGAVNNAWENALNWSCNKVPDGNMDVTINNGTIVVSSAAACRTLAVNPSANLIINPGFSIDVVNH